MFASWPTFETVDDSLLNASNYLMETAHEFRTRSKAFVLAKTKGAKNVVDKSASQNPVKATIYIAKTYPLWQKVVMDTLKNMYEVSGSGFFCLPHVTNDILKLKKKYTKLTISRADQPFRTTRPFLKNCLA